MNRRFFCFLLALTMIAAVMASCVTNGDGDGTRDPSGEGYDNLSSLESAVRQYGSIESLRGKEFTVLSPVQGGHFYWEIGPNENELFYEEPSSEALPNAIYKRNRKLEDSLGIKIKPLFVGTPGAAGDRSSDVSTQVTLGDLAGSHEFDVILNRLDYQMTSAANLELLNYYDIASINLDSAWWDQNIVNSFTIYGDRLYALTGDINYFDDYSVQVILFNQGICTELRLEYPYQAVRDGTWTLDMMTEMAQTAKNEVNGDDVMTPGVDRFGIGEGVDCIFAFLYSHELAMSSVGDSGVPEIMWPTDTSVSVVEKLYGIFTADYTAINVGPNADYFRQDKVLFYSTLLGSLSSMRHMETDFGVLPVPKGNPNMDGYRSYMSNGWSTAFSVPKTLPTDQVYSVGMFLECMAAASRDIISPVFYDQLLEARYIRNSESKEMLEYISASKSYDWAGDLAWADPMRTIYRNVLTSGPASYGRGMEKIRKPLQGALDEFCSNLKKQ